MKWMWIQTPALIAFIICCDGMMHCPATHAQETESSKRNVWDRIQFILGASDAELSAQQKTIAELGRLAEIQEPVTPADLEKSYQLAAGAINTTELWKSGSHIFRNDAFVEDAAGLPIVDRASNRKVPAVGEPWPELEDAQRLLQRYRRQLDQLHEAAQKGGRARFPTQFGDGLRMNMPDLLPILASVRVLALEAHVRAHIGDASGTAQSLTTIFAAARNLENYPHSVAHLVCIATYTHGFDTLRQLLGVLSERELQQISRSLEQSDLDASIHSAILGDRVIGLLELQHPLKYLDFLVAEETEDVLGCVQLTRREADDYARIVPLVKQRDIRCFLRHYRGLLDASRKPLPERIDAVESMTREWDRLGAKNLLSMFGTDSIPEAGAADVAVLAHLIVPEYESTFLANARAIAQQRVTATAVGIKQYRDRTGHMPEELGRLIPDYLTAIPIDPFDGRIVRYIRLTDRCRVYSVGENRKDDGGEGTFLENGEDIVLDVQVHNAR